MGTRSATHAGSWYTDDAHSLGEQLSTWLSKAPGVGGPPRALIVPHAGYSYSGPTAAYGYRMLDANSITTIFILGPSHHAYLTKCGLSQLDDYETPLGNLTLNKQIISNLYATGAFDYLSKGVEEAEHSLEMHLPYIAHVMSERRGSCTIVPIMVGSLSKETEEFYGKLLSPYLSQEGTVFIVSSDFCHWGKRFDYTLYYEDKGPIYASIEALDRRGMEVIETGDPTAFKTYLRETKNTICGRHPIAVLLWALRHSHISYTVQSVHYEQSSKCRNMKDSSVSYAVLAVFEK
jgi:AmmeMemoRadiSam system protein B